MCENAATERAPICSTYQCANGCVHLVWNNVTLHFFPRDWDLLVETISETDRAVRAQRNHSVRGEPTM